MKIVFPQRPTSIKNHDSPLRLTRRLQWQLEDGPIVAPRDDTHRSVVRFAPTGEALFMEMGSTKYASMKSMQ